MKSRSHYGLAGEKNEMGIPKREKNIEFVHGTGIAAAGRRDIPTTGWLKDEARQYHADNGVWPDTLYLSGQSQGTSFTAFMVGDVVVRLNVLYGQPEDRLGNAP